MKIFRIRRAWAVVATFALAAGLTPLLMAGTAAAATSATVHNDEEFFDAWTDSGITQIDLANDIDLTQYGDCGYYPERDQTDPTLLDGHGFTLTSTCDSNSVVYVDSGSALLTVQNITITHSGAPNPTVFGNGIANRQGPVTVLNSTITGNWTNGCGGGDDSVSAAWLCQPWGGGIYAQGDVIVQGSTITNNRAVGQGGGIFTVGSVTVTGSTISGNVVDGSDTGYAYGGGISALGGATIDGSTVAGNQATCNGECTPAGGGLASQGGDVTVTSSSFDGNTATCEKYCDNFGGGILAAAGSLTLAGSSVTNNGATCQDSCEASGGGIFATVYSFYDSVQGASVLGNDVQAAGRGTQTTITDSTLSGNTATTTDAEGGDCDCSGGGLADEYQELVTVTRSTISGNSALYWGGGLSLWNEGTNLRLENSTVNGNTAGGAGGLDVANSAATIVYSTVDGNTATGNIQQPTSAGASKWSAHAADVRAAVTEAPPANLMVVELQTFGSVYADPAGGPNCLVFGEGGPGTDSQGYNFSDDASCGLTGTGDQQSAGSPMLNALAANGGPTLTMMPFTPKSNGTASPLIDAIPVAACQTGAASGVGTDQRGVTRPQLNGCDIGAVEVTGAEYQVEAAVVIQPKFTG